MPTVDPRDPTTIKQTTVADCASCFEPIEFDFAYLVWEHKVSGETYCDDEFGSAIASPAQ